MYSSDSMNTGQDVPPPYGYNNPGYPQQAYPPNQEYAADAKGSYPPGGMKSMLRFIIISKIPYLRF